MWTMALILLSAMFSISIAARILHDRPSGRERMLHERTMLHTGMNYLALGDSYASGLGSGGGLDSGFPRMWRGENP